VATYIKNTASQLILIDLVTRSHADLDIPITDIYLNGIRRASQSSFTVIDSTEISPTALCLIDIKTPSEMQVSKSSTDVTIPDAYFSKPEHNAALRINGSNDGIKDTYALYQPPKNPNYFAPEATFPPAIMLMHGGPTPHSASGLSFVIHYWTTRRIDNDPGELCWL
jgi:dipeptidyl aminopeptidase/acylaminoacyl peptidase